MQIAPTARIGPSREVSEVQMKYVLYARKSTESEERQVLSIDSQVKEMLELAEKEGLEVIDIRREAHSAKDSGQRPVFKEILEDIRRGRYNGILTWAPDRLSRNAGDLGSVVDLMDQKLLFQIRTYGQSFINSPNEKFLLMILCSQAKLENDNKSINVKRGLRTRVEMGLWPGTPPTGYMKEKGGGTCEVIIDPERASIIKQMYEKVAHEKWSGRKLYNWLKFDLNFRTLAGHKHLALGNIYLVLQNTFYYGSFEYPRGSGNWYKGKHEPIITKELFDLAQEQMRSQVVRTEGKEFAFVKLMTCGLCGSGISADEKFKKQKNGNIHRYVYYGCTKAKDKNCKCGYIEEKELLKQFILIINKIDLNEIEIKQQINDEIKRFNEFQKIISGSDIRPASAKIDYRKYATYLLMNGKDIEKREVLGCIKSRIYLAHKSIQIESNLEKPLPMI